MSCSSSLTSPEIYKSTQIFVTEDESVSIDTILKPDFQQENFNYIENEVIKKFDSEKIIWLKIEDVDLKEKKFLSIWNCYTDYAKPYIVQKNNVTSLNEISLVSNTSYDSKYRFPSWELPIFKDSVSIYIQIKDYKRALGTKLLLQNEEEFLDFTKIDYYKTSFISILLFSLLIIVIALFVAKRQFSLIWYAIYIAVFILEFYISMGIDLELNLIESNTIHSVKKLILQSLGGLFIGLFFINFYNFSDKVKNAKAIFKVLIYIYLTSSLLLLSFIVLDKVYLPKMYIWIPQRLALFAVLLAHFYLIKEQKLPTYLGVSFTFPIIGYFAFAFFNYPHDLSLISYFFLENLFYIAIIFEIIFMLYYIINQLVKSEFLAVRLNQENSDLRTNFQDNVLQAQENERSKLLSNVHDSFGGYLEALKLRLLQKNNSPEKIQEILDAFYKEYRYLLNSLYAPKIDAQNFIKNLEDFIGKINKLTDNLITYEFDINRLELSSDKCIHLYRILSELITNSIKHANATEVKISLFDNEKNELHLVVLDNGKGFDVTQTKSNSFGLQSIKERLASINGEINIQSERNKGTEVKIMINTNE